MSNGGVRGVPRALRLPTIKRAAKMPPMVSWTDAGKPMKPGKVRFLDGQLNI
jgi:hypothetical protein